MMIGGVCFLIGTLLVAAAFSTAQLVIGRVVLGFGVGFATQATPLYLSEMAPYNLRGALNIMFQLAVTVGILAAQLINYGTQYLQPWGWRLSLALGGVPALMLFFGAMMLPDTPNSLLERGKKEEGRRVLERIRGTSREWTSMMTHFENRGQAWWTDHLHPRSARRVAVLPWRSSSSPCMRNRAAGADVDAELEDITEAVAVAKSIKNPYTTIFRRRYWPQLIISIMIPIFQQWTGINAIMFYAPQLFESIGHGTKAALLNTVVIGAVNVGSTLVSIVSVDKLGRKILFVGACQTYGLPVQRNPPAIPTPAITRSLREGH